MSKERLIELAEQSGLPTALDYHQKRYEKFAELVRADERNSWPAEMEAMERQVNILTDALAEQPAPVQQEHVADALIRQYINALVSNKPDEAANVTKAMVDYVYTTPQAQPAQRTWVGLTEEEKTELRRKHYPLPLLLMDATEAKLKEKNT